MMSCPPPQKKTHEKKVDSTSLSMFGFNIDNLTIDVIIMGYPWMLTMKLFMK